MNETTIETTKPSTDDRKNTKEYKPDNMAIIVDLQNRPKHSNLL